MSVIHPNVKQTDALLVIIKGEHMGRFGLRICHSHSGSQASALLEIIDRVEDSKPTRTGIEICLPAEYLAIILETKEEKKWNAECMVDRRKQARQ